MKHFQASKIPWFYDIPTAVHTNPKTSLSLLLTHIGIPRNCTAPRRAKESVKLDALRAFTRASNRSIKSYFTKTRIGHNKNKLKNQDILAQELRLGIYYSSCFVGYPPNPIASCEFKPFWFKNEAQLSTRLWRTCLQRIFEVFLQLVAISLYMLAEIVQSSFTCRGDPSKLCN